MTSADEEWIIHIGPIGDMPVDRGRGSRFKVALLEQLANDPTSLEFVVATRGLRNYWIWHASYLVGHPEVKNKTWYASIDPDVTGLVRENDVWVRLGHDEYVETCSAYAHWRARVGQLIPESMFPYYYSVEPI